MGRKYNGFDATIVVKVTNQNKLRLEQLAATRGCSTGALVRLAVGTFLAVYDPEPLSADIEREVSEILAKRSATSDTGN